MDNKLTKSTKILSLRNKQTYPTVQTVIDNTITHKHTLDSSWRNAQIWLAISLGSKSLRPQVCFLDPMLSGT